MKKVILFFIGIFLIGFVSASAVIVQHSGPDLNDYYKAEDRLSTYYPILGNEGGASCLDREDILLITDPVGCQPSVVRSDLLAEQNVPVFCQLDAIKINPFLDIEQIRNIRFSVAEGSENVVGVGFHPARAALRTQDILLGSPIEDNVGYAVVVLKRQPNENNLPDSVSVTLNARMDYYAGNSYGIGRSEFLLREVDDETWQVEKEKQSFFRGQFSIRLIEAEPEKARVAIYQGDDKIQEVIVDRRDGGKVTIPGGYCGVRLNLFYDGFVNADESAFLEVDGDLIQVYRGSKFLNNKCVVRQLDFDGVNGKISLACGNEVFDLVMKEIDYEVGEEVYFIERVQEYRDGIWVINEVGEDLTLIKGDEEITGINPRWLMPANKDKLYEAEYDGDVEEYFDKTIKSYEELVDFYPFEQETGGEKFGVTGLIGAIDLADSFNKKITQERLLDKFEQTYPEEYLEYNLIDKRQRLYSIDSAEAVKVVNIDSGYKTIKLKEFNEIEIKSKAFFSLDEGRFELERGKTYTKGNTKIVLESIEASNVIITTYCSDEIESNSKRLSIRGLSEDSLTVCGETLILEGVDLNEFAKIRLESETKSFSETNVTVKIGIEKRALELNPDKAREKIDNLDKTIEDWSKISQTLGETVKGLKAACFATAGVLTIKNFFSGLSGEAIAREKVMRGESGWTEYCQQQAIREGISIDKCFSENSDEINEDVRAMTRIIEEDNKILESLTNKNSKSTGIFESQIIDSNSVKEEFVGSFGNLNDKTIKVDDEEVEVGELIDPEFIGINEAKDLKLWLNVREGDFSPAMKARAESELAGIAQAVSDRQEAYANSAGLTDNLQGGLKGTGVGIYSSSGVDAEYYGGFVNNGDYGLDIEEQTPAQLITYNGKTYLALLQKTQGNDYAATEFYEWNGNSVGETAELQGNFRTFKKIDANTYRKKINNPEIKYYEIEPYKGLPAIVPFDIENGWYAATQQSLPGFGNVKAFESSGRVASFWLCHVNGDGNMDFLSTSFGDDKCRQFNLNTGQALDQFPGLNEAEAKRKVDEAVRALNEAASQYGKGNRVSILGQTLRVGSPAASVPGTQCQDFMSPDDCNLLFNVCDPVVCPTSRCDFGGAYPVDNVVQSGIIGSTLLCLPNSVAFGGDVVVPVCLSGIHAGVEGYLSILEQHKACLEANIESGETVGICDEITSVYTCEFFWRQAAPLAKSLLPKIIEYAYTGSQSRGGGEYMTVQSAFANTESSIDYFTNYYAANTFEAFKARSIEEAGSEFCRAFVSVKAPTDFETLIEPESPPQFHAFFSQIPFSDATVPATAQYKVYYHIFAGDNRGVSFNVYLKDPPQSSYYNSNPIIQVASGFIARGQSVSETKDFTSPVGYQQLCVNINGDEECGFQQVSTSFAINYLRDEIVSGQLTRTDISSEAECVSGGANPAALLNPNIQEAGQELLDPAIYNRGIVRVCSTDNPGLGTNPTRFVDVGYCGAERVRCWLDKESIDEALTANNLGVKEETLEELDGISKDLLKDNEFITTEANRIYNEINLRFEEFKDGNAWSGEVNGAESFVLEIENLIDRMYLSVDKAKMTLLKARVYESVSWKLFKALSINSSGGHEDLAEEREPSGRNDETPIAEEDEETEEVQLTLDKDYDSNKKINLVLNGELTNVSFLNNQIRLDTSTSPEVVGFIDKKSKGDFLIDRIDITRSNNEFDWSLIDNKIIACNKILTDQEYDELDDRLKIKKNGTTGQAECPPS